MIEIKRNRKIREEYTSGKRNTRELAEKYNLSQQRISQIVNTKEYHCDKHNTYYYTSCPECVKKDDYERFIKSSYYLKNLDKIKFCSIKDNDREKALLRKKYVNTLVDKFGLSFVIVGKILNRHYSSISYIYYGRD